MDNEYKQFAENERAAVLEAIHRFRENGPYRYADRSCVFCGGAPSYHEFPCTWLDLLEVI